MNILLILSGIGGFIIIVDKSIVIIKWASITVSNILFWRRIDKNLKRKA